MDLYRYMDHQYEQIDTLTDVEGLARIFKIHVGGHFSSIWRRLHTPNCAHPDRINFNTTALSTIFEASRRTNTERFSILLIGEYERRRAGIHCRADNFIDLLGKQHNITKLLEELQLSPGPGVPVTSDLSQIHSTNFNEHRSKQRHYLNRPTRDNKPTTCSFCSSTAHCVWDITPSQWCPPSNLPIQFAKRAQALRNSRTRELERKQADKTTPAAKRTKKEWESVCAAPIHNNISKTSKKYLAVVPQPLRYSENPHYTKLNNISSSILLHPYLHPQR